mgnify:CR=1 FL=1
MSLESESVDTDAERGYFGITVPTRYKWLAIKAVTVFVYFLMLLPLVVVVSHRPGTLPEDAPVHPERDGAASSSASRASIFAHTAAGGSSGSASATHSPRCRSQRRTRARRSASPASRRSKRRRAGPCPATGGI